MIRLETSVVVNRPPAATFDYVATRFFSHLPVLNTDVVEIKQLSDGPMRVGLQGFEAQVIQGKRYGRTFEVTEYEVPKVFAYKSIANDAVKEYALCRYTFEPAGDGTRVTQYFDIEWEAPLWRWAPWMVKFFIKKAVEKSVTVNLKKAVEGS